MRQQIHDNTMWTESGQPEPPPPPYLQYPPLFGGLALPPDSLLAPADPYAAAAAVAQHMQHLAAAAHAPAAIGAPDGAGLDLTHAQLHGALRLPYATPDLPQLLGLRGALHPPAPHDDAAVSSPQTLLEALHGLQGVVPSLLALQGVAGAPMLPFLPGMPPLPLGAHALGGLPALLGGAHAAPHAAAPSHAPGHAQHGPEPPARGEGGGRASKKGAGSRLIWTEELHGRFLSAVDALGGHERMRRVSPALFLSFLSFVCWLPLPSRACVALLSLHTRGGRMFLGGRAVPPPAPP